MQHHLILRVIAKFVIPYTLLFALYVQFHGDFGPGGGFQAGVIFGAAMILYTLVFGLDNAERVAPPGALRLLMVTGALIYAGTGVTSMLLGANFLDYDVLARDPHYGQHYGILLVEFGVGVTVASTMMAIFFAFAERGETDNESA